MWIVFSRRKGKSRVIRVLPDSTADDQVLGTGEYAERWNVGANAPDRSLPERTSARPYTPTQCTCAVRMWSATHLPDCPRGLAQGNRYASWDDVPNDTLTEERYTARNGHPPPRCPTCRWMIYERDPDRCLCTIRPDLVAP